MTLNVQKREQLDYNFPYHQIDLEQITAHGSEDIALVNFKPKTVDPDEIIAIAIHHYRSHEMYYTIGHGLIGLPKIESNLLQGTSTIAMPRIEYIENYTHRQALGAYDMPVMNNISSICDGDSGNYSQNNQRIKF